MTSGTITKNALSPVQVYINGSPLTTANAGLFLQKTWVGGDSPKGMSVRTKTKHYYYVPRHKFPGDRKVIRRSYVTSNRVKYKRVPHTYDMTGVDTIQPAGVFRKRTTGSGGVILSEDLYSNCPISLFIPSVNAIPTASWTSSDQYKLIAKLREKVVGTSFNAGVFLGESHKTLRMIGDTAVKLAKSLTRLRKGDFAGAIAATADPRSAKYSKKYGSRRGVQNEIANKRLEVVYGWTPLFQDMVSGAESLSHTLNVPFTQKYVCNRLSADSSRNSRLGFEYASYLWDVPGYSTWQRRVVAEISDDPSYIGTIKLLDPLEIVWELTPFSFVVDWFLPVGDFLEARSASQLLTGKYVITDRVSVVGSSPWNAKFKFPAPGTETTIEDLSGGTQLRRRILYRTLSTSLSVPMPEVKPLKKALSYQHCLNGLALMSQVFGSK